MKILTCFLIRAIYKQYDYASKNCKMAYFLALSEDMFGVLKGFFSMASHLTGADPAHF